MWRCFVRDQARVPSVAGAVAPFFVTGTVFFSAREIYSSRPAQEIFVFDFLLILSSRPARRRAAPLRPRGLHRPVNPPAA